LTKRDGSDNVRRMIEEYEYLWNHTDPNWVLLKAPNSSDRYVVFNKQGSMLIIENDELKSAICQRMKDAGCEILETLPMLGPAIAKSTKQA
jgi:hypothetical protein